MLANQPDIAVVNKEQKMPAIAAATSERMSMRRVSGNKGTNGKALWMVKSKTVPVVIAALLHNNVWFQRRKALEITLKLPGLY